MHFNDDKVDDDPSPNLVSDTPYRLCVILLSCHTPKVVLIQTLYGELSMSSQNQCADDDSRHEDVIQSLRSCREGQNKTYNEYEARFVDSKHADWIAQQSRSDPEGSFGALLECVLVMRAVDFAASASSACHSRRAKHPEIVGTSL